MVGAGGCELPWLTQLAERCDWTARPCHVFHQPRPLCLPNSSHRSVTLLDCFTIPMVVALSTALLGAAYHRRHFAGAGICIAGLVLLLVTDRSSSSGSGSSSNPLLGDGLVLLGASLYALCNVLQEWLLGALSRFGGREWGGRRRCDVAAAG